MKWSSDKVREELLTIFRDHAQDGAAVKIESHLVADLGIDSLGVWEIVETVEDKFALVIPEDALRNVETVADVQVAIEKKLTSEGRLDG